MKKIALFPGSFDPLTNGHLDIIERASLLFDNVMVAVMTNTHKQSLFSPQEKLDLVEQATNHLENVQVVAHQSGLTVELARELGVRYLIRGLRNSQDFEYEKNIAWMNLEISDNIETVFLLSTSEHSKLSSSIVKEIAVFGGDVSKFLPKNINQAIVKKYQEK